MSREDDFLTRWSHRKREAAEVAKSKPPARPGEPDAAAAAAADSDVAPTKDVDAPPEFDPATLPPIDSITAVSDITAFLRAGVPAELTRAALRRVWTADPAIRDFVGLAENAWDFTDPNAMPGFGPLESTDEVRRMIARIVDSIGEVAQPAEGKEQPDNAQVLENQNDSNVIEPAEKEVESPPRLAAVSVEAGNIPAEILGNQVLLQSNKEDAATQRDVAEIAEKPKQLVRRIHGGALPE